MRGEHHEEEGGWAALKNHSNDDDNDNDRDGAATAAVTKCVEGTNITSPSFLSQALTWETQKVIIADLDQNMDGKVAYEEFLDSSEWQYSYYDDVMNLKEPVRPPFLREALRTLEQFQVFRCGRGGREDLQDEAHKCSSSSSRSSCSVGDGDDDDDDDDAEPVPSSSSSSSSSSFSSSSSLPLSFPRIIHQTWKTADKIPKSVAGWMHSWPKKNPTWRHVFWSDSDNRLLVQQHLGMLLPFFDALKPVEQADVARYLYLYYFGGVYADLDFEALQSMDAIRKHLERIGAVGFVGEEPRAHTRLLEHRKGLLLSNAILASPGGHPFWLALVAHIMLALANGDRGDPVSSTGPRILTKVYK
eukprot:jgi/Bigna1/139370/aug1.50_g14078